MGDVRVLEPADQAALEAFLMPRIATSMFLLGNSRAVGLVDRGERLQGTYAATFNTRTREAVQVGGVYTPPSLRGHGYARAAVAGSLIDARAGGADLAILFTGDDNVAAQRAYAVIGFQQVGDYRIIRLKS